jgi:predicted outer membrane repeat protein
LYLSINGSSFTSNTAKTGGAIYSYGVLQVYNSTFTLCSVTTFGGAIHFEGGVGSVENCSFGGNSANDSGIVALICIMLVINILFPGGAISSNVQLDIKNSNFSNNNAVNSGGSLYALSSSNITTYWSSFYQCTASMYFLAYLYFVLTSSSKEIGGAIYVSSESSYQDVGSTVNNNSALQWGGGLFVSMNQPTLRNTTFNFNTAQLGGAVYTTGKHNIIYILLMLFANFFGLFFQVGLNCYYCTFYANNATVIGGGIFSNAALTLITNNFTSNYAQCGGMVLSSSPPNFRLSICRRGDLWTIRKSSSSKLAFPRKYSWRSIQCRLYLPRRRYCTRAGISYGLLLFLH